MPHRNDSIQLFWNGLFQKKKQGGLRTYFFEKTLDIFLFFFASLEISGKTKLHPWKFGKIMYFTSLGNFKAQKSRPLEMSHEFLLVSLGNSTLFLVSPWKFCMLFLEYPWKFYILTLFSPLPLLLDFFWKISKTQC